MSCRSELAELLPLYAADTLGQDERRAVDAHLTACADCREELAFWQEVGGAVVAADRALGAPSPALVEGALAQARSSTSRGSVANLPRVWERHDAPRGQSRGRFRAFARAWALLVCQVPLVRQELWLASALVMAVGYLAAVLQGGSRSGSIVGALAPLVAAAGLAMIYGPENDPGLELALATPTSPRQVLLARLVVVFGYNLALGLAATVGLVAVVPPQLLSSIVMGWLAPMTFLSALALVLSMVVGTGNAVTVAVGLWLMRGLSAGARMDGIGVTEAAFASVLQAYARAWHNPALLFALAAALVVVALALAGRQARLVPMQA